MVRKLFLCMVVGVCAAKMAVSHEAAKMAAPHTASPHAARTPMESRHLGGAKDDNRFGEGNMNRTIGILQDGCAF